MNAKTPNEWTSERDDLFGDSYFIVDKSGLTLEISCTGNYDGKDEHTILLYKNYKEILERSKEDKIKFLTTHSFKFDGQAHPFPPMHTRARKEANEWRDFRNSIAEARKIEVLRKNKVIATFYPSLASLNVLSDVKYSRVCKAIMD